MFDSADRTGLSWRKKAAGAWTEGRVMLLAQYAKVADRLLALYVGFNAAFCRCLPLYLGRLPAGRSADDHDVLRVLFARFGICPSEALALGAIWCGRQSQLPFGDAADDRADPVWPLSGWHELF